MPSWSSELGLTEGEHLMIGASKILTVSYGTFSCTLEGFDDPFSTMKAIAEYFRDLAADDRYFGAEPPQPDAAMLNRIAEREVQRRVESQVQPNGVLLRAERPAELAPAAQAAVAQVPVAQAVATAAPAMEAPVAPRVAPAATAAAAAAASPAAESIAAKLKRIREAVEQARSEGQAPAAAGPAAMADEPEAEEDLVPPPVARAFPEVVEPAVAAPTAAPVAALVAEAARAAETVEAAPEVTEASVETPVETPVAEAEAAPVAEAAPEPHALTAPMAETEAAADAAAEAVAADQRPRPRVIKVRRIEPADAGGKAVFETSYHEPDAEAPRAVEAETAAEPVAEPKIASTLPEEAEAELQAELAELDREMAAALPPVPEAAAPIVEAPAAEAEAEIAEAEIAETETAPKAAAATETPDETPAELLAELLAELPAESREALEAEAAKPAQPGPVLQKPDDVVEKPLRHSLVDVVESDEASLERLMRQTASELDEPGARRRQATMAHLKAAVAATHAEKEISGDTVALKETADLTRYRDDLAQVVRPRRPALPGVTAARPAVGPDRPAPLVLVSEQRVDGPTRSDPVVIRPRRIATSNAVAIEAEDEDLELEDDAAGENIFANAKSFAAFAERIGATELPDLLEAADAYAACVEGRPSFTRPQILRSAVEAAEQPFSLEQSLRSFGTLLRQGKIQKVKRGQFAIAETSRYLSEARKIAR